MAVEWIAKIVEAMKLPLRYMWVVLLVTAFLLFSPASWLDRLSLSSFKNSYAQIIAILFISSGAIITVSLFESSYKYFRRAFHRRKALTNALIELSNLDPKEKAILREFFIQDQGTILLPIDQPNVAGLIRKGILVTVGAIGERSLAGFLFPVAIRKEIKDILTFDEIGIPEELTETEIEKLTEERPDFLPEIERHREVWHTSYSRLRRRPFN